ncbi:efflux RND transporter periplasmic adaptor subunit, partial [Candidatus Riflebacteria bacterium]
YFGICKKMKKTIILLVFVAFVALTFNYWKKAPEKGEKKKNPVKKIQVEKGPITLMVSSTGRVVSNLDVEIKCKASGEVLKLPYDVSDPVKKGELLVELDPVNEQRSVNKAKVTLQQSRARLAKEVQSFKIAEEDLKLFKKRAKVSLISAQAKLKDAKARTARLKNLLKKNFASKESFESSETTTVYAETDVENARIKIEEFKTEEMALELKRQDLELAKAQVDLSEITLSDAVQRLQETKVYSPIDGILSASNVQIGQIISSGISNVGGGTTVMVLSDLTRIFVLAFVDESDIGKIGVDQKARITVDAFPGKNFRGSVVRIAPKGVVTSNVVTYEVKIEVMGRNKSLLKQEMTANVEIIAGSRQEALLLPSHVVYQKRRQRYVSVPGKDGKVEEREVVVGIDNGINIEIISGLALGDKIEIPGEKAGSQWRRQRGQLRTARMMMGGSRGRR